MTDDEPSAVPVLIGIVTGLLVVMAAVDLIGWLTR